VLEHRENQGLAQCLAHRVLPAPPLGRLAQPTKSHHCHLLGSRGRLTQSPQTAGLRLIHTPQCSGRPRFISAVDPVVRDRRKAIIAGYSTAAPQGVNQS
jgi:hypothetical protein